MPYILAEYKIGTGYIFEKYLRRYSHWTYTDADVIWGRLDEWIDSSELHKYDIITISKINDAERFFLRGQFTLHRNINRLNSLWLELDHMKPMVVLKRLAAIIDDIRKKRNHATIKFNNFISAEGPYSTLVFSRKDMHVLIAGRMLNDKLSRPVVFNQGILYRCMCENISHCATIRKNSDNFCALRDSMELTGASRPDLSLVEELIRRDSCNMNWLDEADRKCALLRGYPGRIYNEVVYRKGRFFVNNETKAHRILRSGGAFFHFRQWEDGYARSIISNDNYDSVCFMTYLYPRRQEYVRFGDPYMLIHECDSGVVEKETRRIASHLKVVPQAEREARREAMRKQILYKSSGRGQRASDLMIAEMA
ncbi:unnamed protein product [Symbiodinium microadriaticum]|nr:unnamed protein product [Symbiodinium microadriaticum]